MYASSRHVFWQDNLLFPYLLFLITEQRLYICLMLWDWLMLIGGTGFAIVFIVIVVFDNDLKCSKCPWKMMVLYIWVYYVGAVVLYIGHFNITRKTIIKRLLIKLGLLVDVSAISFITWAGVIKQGSRGHF